VSGALLLFFLSLWLLLVLLVLSPSAHIHSSDESGRCELLVPLRCCLPPLLFVLVPPPLLLVLALALVLLPLLLVLALNLALLPLLVRVRVLDRIPLLLFIHLHRLLILLRTPNRNIEEMIAAKGGQVRRITSNLGDLELVATETDAPK
jgi:hypothetical protein